jgi:hypothetical protein
VLEGGRVRLVDVRAPAARDRDKRHKRMGLPDCIGLICSLDALMQKLYCYVDETGQDTVAQDGKKLALFVVGVVVVNTDQHLLENACSLYEKETGKGMVPWHKAKYAAHLSFMRTVVADRRLGIYRATASCQRSQQSIYPVSRFSCKSSARVQREYYFRT